MAGLIEEIQRDALDSKVPIEAMLRRVKLAAAKLQLQELEAWVEHELNGYPSDIPEYRIAHGQPAAWNPYHGWIPVQTGDGWLADMLSEAKVGQSISSLRDLIERDGGSGVLHFPIPQGFVAELNKLMNYQTARMVIQIPRGHIVGILDKVRSMVLDWAIEMERKGVLGEGMSFNDVERKEAQHVMANLTIGSIGSVVGNIGSGNITGDITASNIAVPQVLEVTNKIKAALPELANAGADAAALIKTIEAIETEAASETPNHGRLRGLLADARSALVGAAGNLTADGAIAGVAALLKALGGGGG